MRTLWVVAVLALGMGGGCFGPGIEQAVKERYEEKVAKWQAEHPEDVPLSEAKGKELLAQAAEEIKAEFTAKYGEHAAGALSSAASGNLIGVGFNALGAILLFFGLRKKVAA